jgi:hypothetical protein
MSRADFQHTPSASAQFKTANEHDGNGEKCEGGGDERREIMRVNMMARNARKDSNEEVMMTWPTLDDMMMSKNESLAKN